MKFQPGASLPLKNAIVCGHKCGSLSYLINAFVLSMQMIRNAHWKSKIPFILECKLPRHSKKKNTINCSMIVKFFSAFDLKTHKKKNSVLCWGHLSLFGGTAKYHSENYVSNRTDGIS